MYIGYLYQINVCVCRYMYVYFQYDVLHESDFCPIKFSFVITHPNYCEDRFRSITIQFYSPYLPINPEIFIGSLVYFIVIIEKIAVLQETLRYKGYRHNHQLGTWQSNTHFHSDSHDDIESNHANKICFCAVDLHNDS